MLHVAVNAISLSDTFFKKLPRTHSAVAFSKTKPAALGFDLDVKAKISGMKPPDKKKSTAKRCFSFWVPVQADISIRMEGKSLDKHSAWGID